MPGHLYLVHLCDDTCFPFSNFWADIVTFQLVFTFGFVFFWVFLVSAVGITLFGTCVVTTCPFKWETGGAGCRWFRWRSRRPSRACSSWRPSWCWAQSKGCWWAGKGQHWVVWRHWSKLSLFPTKLARSNRTLTYWRIGSLLGNTESLCLVGEISWKIALLIRTCQLPVTYLQKERREIKEQWLRRTCTNSLMGFESCFVTILRTEKECPTLASGDRRGKHLATIVTEAHFKLYGILN